MQINLDEVRNVTGMDLGGGLLQLWVDITETILDDASEIRIIPEQEYSET